MASVQARQGLISSRSYKNPKRQFIVRENGRYSVTELGEEYIRIVPKELKAPELTRQFEEDLSRVNDGKLTKEAFLQGLLADISNNITRFTSNPIPDKEKIGYEALTQKQNQKAWVYAPNAGPKCVQGSTAPIVWQNAA